MRVRFRGVRGSVSWVMPEAVAYGCNTPCLELTDEASGATLVLDAGSGIAGVRLAAGARVSLLLTHYHWDHVLGLPFFAPLYDPASALSLHTPALQSHDPHWLETIFAPAFYPLPYCTLPNHPSPRLVHPGPVAIDGFEVTAQPLSHPGGALAYRVSGGEGDVVYATDHEFGDPAVDGPLGVFAAGAAAIVCDAQFTPEELPSHRGWGHSDWRQCAQFAAAHDIKTLYLFHHRPGRTDRELEGIEADARRVFARTHAAREGYTFVV